MKARWREERAQARRERRRPTAPTGEPPVVNARLDINKVKQALRETEKVDDAAKLLGIRPSYLSQHLNRIRPASDVLPK